MVCHYYYLNHNHKTRPVIGDRAPIRGCQGNWIAMTTAMKRWTTSKAKKFEGLQQRPALMYDDITIHRIVLNKLTAGKRVAQTWD